MAATTVPQSSPPAFRDEKAGYSGEKGEKGDVAYLETTEVLDGGEPVKGKADYSGFAQKSDPREIKLVRKMDIRIMLSLWSMYWLNYLSVSLDGICNYRADFSTSDRNAIALARLSSLEDDLGLTDTQYVHACTDATNLTLSSDIRPVFPSFSLVT